MAEAESRLKTVLISSPLFHHPDFWRHSYVQCDASDVKVGVILFQKDDSEESTQLRLSHKLTPAHKNYSMTEREFLAIKKFRPYILFMPFSVITVHGSLKWLMLHRDLSIRTARWSQSYDFTIEHRHGKPNIVPDTLSRYEIVEVSAGIEEMVDLTSSALNASDYLEVVCTI